MQILKLRKTWEGSGKLTQAYNFSSPADKPLKNKQWYFWKQRANTVKRPVLLINNEVKVK